MSKARRSDRTLATGEVRAGARATLTGREGQPVVALLFGAGAEVSGAVRRVLLPHLTHGAVVVVQRDAVQRHRRVVAERLDGESRPVPPPAGANHRESCNHALRTV